MDPSSFDARAWNNGRWHATGAGYGLKISAEDRDKYFDTDWDTVTLRLIGERTRRVAEANITKDSFWSPECRELIQLEIGQWFIENGFRRWTLNVPPRFRMLPVAGRDFEVRPDRS